MLRRLGHFLTYHNAVPLTVVVVMVGASSTYAVNNPEVLFAETTEVVSIDNTYIASVNLDTFTPYTEILSVEEDDEFYFVTYSVSTIELQDAIWQDIETTNTLRVRKTRLGQYGDLGLYVTEQLKQVIDTELARLRATQATERVAVTQKRQVTKYSGLIGGRLNATSETIPGYQPRVRPPRPVPEPMRLAGPGPGSTVSGPRVVEAPPSRVSQEPFVRQVIIEDFTQADDIETVSNDVGQSGGGGTNQETVVEPAPAPESPAPPATSTPYLQLLGDTEIILTVGSVYTDLGVVVIDAQNINPEIKRFKNGQPVATITISTVAPSETILEYRLVKGDVIYDVIQRTVRVVAVVDDTATDEVVPPETSEPATSTAPKPTDTTTNTNPTTSDELPKETPPPTSAPSATATSS